MYSFEDADIDCGLTGLFFFHVGHGYNQVTITIGAVYKIPEVNT